ncbi:MULTISPECIES: fructose-6-phosphate aldolase [Sinorhizobium]|uniref:Probable transaldolase n=1 Tax=Sinorhizobium americanum TaxID=194963 RepID=A0A2S3YTW5_9HYPH|nr:MULTISPECIES: fructose-6-phosphate aldolase [Sinorhizobium]PDT38128.1 fructose-6-phosphate aldolase [Sinorhizobium sp. FG01]POH35076.1 fructose-6-phosphate aldolase [Sinorhizobium americanum]
MKFFVDTADIGEIRELAAAGVVDGVTTNPSLIAKAGRPIREVIKEICEAIEGPVSAEVTATEFGGMVAEGERLASIAPNVAIKVPSTWDGFRACRALSERGLKVNVTLCFSANQALLAAKAGAAYISPFVGRLDDIGLDGMEVVREIRAMYNNDESFNTEILASSIRTPLHVTQAAMAGADIATVPPGVLRSLSNHPLTERGLASFLADWGRSGQAIL